MRLTRPTPTERWARRAYDAIIVLGALTAALCFVLLLVRAGALAVIAVGAAYYLRPTRLPPS